jgi:hypothetical protein
MKVYCVEMIAFGGNDRKPKLSTNNRLVESLERALNFWNIL